MGATWRHHLAEDGPGRMRIKKHGRMLADAIMVSEPDMLGEGVDDRSPQQLVNTAELPGIVGEAWAMAIGTSDMGSQSAELSQHQWITANLGEGSLQVAWVLT